MRSKYENGAGPRYERLKYEVNYLEEFKQRWMVFGVLVTLLFAVVTPGIGAQGGNAPACSIISFLECIAHHLKTCNYFVIAFIYLSALYTIQWVGFRNSFGLLHTEYTRYLPLAYIYFSAGIHSDVDKLKRTWQHSRFHLYAQTHVFVITPVIVAFLVEVFKRFETDERILKGALLSSCGSTASWLSVGIQTGARGDSYAIISAVLAHMLSVVVMPLSLLIVCGKTSFHPLDDFVLFTLQAVLPFALGLYLKDSHDWHKHCRGTMVKLAVLLLLYIECCTELLRAEGQLDVRDVLLTFALVCSWLSASIVICYAAAAIICPQYAALAVLCATHKSFYSGWYTTASCSTSGLSQLPAVLAAPAQAAMLAALHAQIYRHDEVQADDEECLALVVTE